MRRVEKVMSGKTSLNNEEKVEIWCYNACYSSYEGRQDLVSVLGGVRRIGKVRACKTSLNIE